MTGDIRLSKRLTAIADMVGACSAGGRSPDGGYCLCDVGTDHAHIPIRLLKDGRISHSIAMDVIEGPLEKARQNIERYGVSDHVTLRLSDGLDAYVPGEADGLVIAGMGGRIMNKILLREPSKTLDFDELILQPQADPEFVRRALRELGLGIDREEIVLEDNKYYPVIHVVHSPTKRPDWKVCCGQEKLAQVRTAAAPPDAPPDAPDMAREKLWQDAEDLFGPYLIRERDAMLRSYLLWTKGVNDRILHSIGRADAGRSDVSLKKAELLRRSELIRAALAYIDRS